MPEKGFRALGIWLGIVCMVIALLFPLHHTVMNNAFFGVDKLEARPLDVLQSTWSETGSTLISSSAIQYINLPGATGLLLYMNIIWVLLIGLGILMLLLEYFRAHDMKRFNQFAIGSMLLSLLAVVIFYYSWSGYLLAKHSFGFVETTSDHATGMGIGLYAAIFGTIVSLLVVLQGYLSKHR